MSHFRYCRLRDERVIIAPERLKRPNNFMLKKEIKKDISNCPFERGNEHLTPNEIFSVKDRTGDWQCRVVPNLYHALSIDKKIENKLQGFFENQSGLGAHEVIIDTPYHYVTMNEYSIEHYKNYLEAIIHRLKDLENDKRLQYIQVFKNVGVNAGATIEHPHTQIMATPFIPADIEKEIENKRKYYNETKRSLLGDMINQELQEDKRVIYKNSDFVVFAPYASFFPFEVMIAPITNISDLAHLNDEQIVLLSEAMKYIFAKMYKLLGNFDFNIIFKTRPPTREHTDPNYFYKMDQFYRFYIQIIPRMYKQAGFELATKMQINPVKPELAAEQLKK